MIETLNVLYRLFAPMFVVVLIIGGVGLSSSLLKNNHNTQSAAVIATTGGGGGDIVDAVTNVSTAASTTATQSLSTSTSAGCPSGNIPVNNSVCKARNILTGKILPNPCFANVPNAGVVQGVCTDFNGIGCCMATKWLSGSAATKLQIKDLLGSKFTSSIVQGLLLGGGGSSSGYGGSGETKPKCISTSKSPTLPIVPGESATISWVQSGGLSQTVIVTPGVGIVRGTSVQVAPKESTTYTVKLVNTAGQSKCPAVRIHVGPRDMPADGVDDVVQTTGDTDGGTDTPNDPSNLSDTLDSSIYNDLYFYNPDSLTDTQDLVTEIEDTEVKYYAPPGVNIGDDIVSDGDAGITNVDKGDWYDYSDTKRYNNTQNRLDEKGDSSGLTDQEIYGIWNRPKSPATGGIGLTGGYVGDDASTMTSESETPGIFSRIGSWFKNILCPWCENSASRTSHTYTASAIISTGAKETRVASCTTGGADTGIFINKAEVNKASCDISMTAKECEESWAGKRIDVQWRVPCNNVCTLTTNDTVLRARLTEGGGLGGIITDDTQFTLTCIDSHGDESLYSKDVRVIQ